MKTKLITIIILICLITTAVGAGLGYPKPVEAQVATIEVGPEVQLSFWQKTWNVIKDALSTASAVAYKNALQYFLNKIAYDTATHIATGSPGQKPLFVTEGWNTYFKNIGDQALGEYFTTLGDKMWGKNLCEPLDPLVKVRLTVAARQAFEPKKPRCTWTQIRKNITDLRDLKLDQLVELSTYFQPRSNELGAYLTIRSGSKTWVNEQITQSELERIIEGEFKSLTSPISGSIKTPAWLIKMTSGEIWPESIKPYMTYTGEAVADAIGVFTNTLTSKLLQRIFKKGFVPEAGVIVSDFWTMGGLAAARLFFGELAEPSYSFDVGVAVTTELSMQVEEGAAKQFNNVIDDKFARAIDEKCTLGQATRYYKLGDDAYRPECAGLISGTAYFGFDEGGQQVPLMSGLPYRSILVLRKFRIVPVGWELAAQYYRNFDLEENIKLNLNFLMNQYDEKYIDDAQTIPNPYYGLVDPDWLLKAPITRCVRQGAGSQKIEQDPYPNPENPEETIYPFQRQDYCADYQTCLDDTSGSSSNCNWGYCVEEKPIWNINGKECDKKYYATCQTLINTQTGQRSSYLLNTVSNLNDLTCEDAAGCREYCTQLGDPFDEQDWMCDVTDELCSAVGSSPYDDENWACDIEASNQVGRIYLDHDSEECGEEGCHLFYSSGTKDSDEIEDAYNTGQLDPGDLYYDENAYGLLDEDYVKLAPYYYTCQGYTIPVSGMGDRDICETVGYFWREDLHVCVESGYEECANFVKHCRTEDLNCKLYTPISTQDPAVPAVITPKDCPEIDEDPWCADETRIDITWNDECPASCVGYKTYHQMETQFEPAEDPDLIASTATTCSQAGCDQFTNLDEVARGGEGIEYYSYLRQCIKPEQGGWLTYYTWEGSDTAGYQLKRWELLADGPGPAGEICFDLTDEDCREFYDQELNSYMRYYSTTVVVSDDCHPFRRSVAETDGGTWCTAQSGQMSGSYCIYQAIPQESIRCSASNAGCREYKSNAGYNYQRVIESYFTLPGDLGGWSSTFGPFEVSNESVRRGDYSLKLGHSSAAGGTLGNAVHELVAGDLEENKIYTLEFLAKGAGTITAYFVGGTLTVDSATLSLIDDDNWHYYTLKLPDLRPTGLTVEETDNNALSISVVRSSGSDEIYLDNIVLKKIQSLLLIKNSWATPVECEMDPPLPGGTASESMLNCESYQDSDNQYINLKSFTQLCFEEVVGCELVIDSANTKKPLMSDDFLDYFVLDSGFTCDENNKGCTRLGLITPDRELDEITGDLVYAFEDKYKIIDPEKNWEQICLDTEIYCEEYEDNTGNPYYFRDPLIRVCEFRENEDAWYKVGSDERCIEADEYPLTLLGEEIYVKHCVGGKSIELDNSCESHSDCTNLAYPDQYGVCVDWVGLCEDKSSGCREYQDPQEPEACDKALLNYRMGYCESITPPPLQPQQCTVDAGDNTIGCGFCTGGGSEHCVSDSDCPTGEACDLSDECLIGTCLDNNSLLCNFDNAASVCGVNGACIPFETCNYYYYKDIEECGAVNPGQGCVAFCQTNEEREEIRSYKVCENDLSITCEDDSDCQAVGGRCVFTNQ